jgi:CCR4-NOT transcriptional regulation complex NOT5 subunit
VKAFSKEGLSMEAKLDPLEAQKAEAREFVNQVLVEAMSRLCFALPKL